MCVCVHWRVRVHANVGVYACDVVHGVCVRACPSCHSCCLCFRVVLTRACERACICACVRVCERLGV